MEIGAAPKRTGRPGRATARGASQLVRNGAVAAALSPTARALVRRIGRTPLLPLPSPAPGVRLLGKAEWWNPGGSVKDRAAWSMVREALVPGLLPGRRLLDASSGNTGIAYAMLGAAIGFGVTILLPSNASRERFRTLAAYGAEVIATDPLEGTDGSIRRAREMAAADPGRFWYADQYANPANWRAHYEGTGPEIWRQTGGTVTHFVVGLGTTGTLVGAGRYLREASERVEVVGVEPAEAMHGIEGLKHLETAAVPAIFDPAVAHRRVRVETEDAHRVSGRLAREAGLFVGASAGAAVGAARRLARELATEGREATVVVILPDGGTRYLSEAWWSDGEPES